MLKTRWLAPLGAGILLFWFLWDAATVRQSVSDALRLCAVSVIPALFPFLAVSGMLVSTGCGQTLAPLLSGLMVFYHLPGQAASAFILGFLGGYPVGARTAAELYQKGMLTRDEAERLLGFCNNANPAFLLNILGLGVFGNSRIGIWLLIIHVASAMLTGLCLFRGTQRDISGRRGAMPEADIIQETPFFRALVESVGNAALAMLRICGFVIFFYTLASPTRVMGNRAGVILTGFVDLFSLTPLLKRDIFSFITAAALSGWGGCGVLCQTAAALEGSGLSVRNCILGKAAQGLLSGVLAACAAAYLF